MALVSAHSSQEGGGVGVGELAQERCWLPWLTLEFRMGAELLEGRGADTEHPAPGTRPRDRRGLEKALGCFIDPFEDLLSPGSSDFRWPSRSCAASVLFLTALSPWAGWGAGGRGLANIRGQLGRQLCGPQELLDEGSGEQLCLHNPLGNSSPLQTIAITVMVAALT